MWAILCVSYAETTKWLLSYVANKNEGLKKKVQNQTDNIVQPRRHSHYN